MGDFWFYVQLGLHHVLDPTAYDHILFLVALAAPFTFRQWKKVLLLATAFTIAHCLSLALSAYGWVSVNMAWIEFLIPITILFTAVFNLVRLKKGVEGQSLVLQVAATSFFGLIHGFGFSNYFRMLMSDEEDKLTPLLGFALGIEVSQVIIVLGVLLLAYLLQDVLRLDRRIFVAVLSILVILVTIPLAIATLPV